MLKTRSLRFAALLAASPGLAPSALAAAESPQTNKPCVFETVDSDLVDSAPDLVRWAVVYRDDDADGVGAPPRSIPCLGQALPAGFSFKGDDADAAVQEDEDLRVELILSP